MAKRKISGIINATEHPMNLETPWNQKQPDGTYHAYAGDDIEAFLKKELSNRTPTEELVSGETKPPTSGTVFDAMVGTVTDVDVQDSEDGTQYVMTVKQKDNQGGESSKEVRFSKYTDDDKVVVNIDLTDSGGAGLPASQYLALGSGFVVKYSVGVGTAGGGTVDGYSDLKARVIVKRGSTVISEFRDAEFVGVTAGQNRAPLPRFALPEGWHLEKKLLCGTVVVLSLRFSKALISEVSFYGRDEETGLDVRVRPDYFNVEENIGVNAVISFKTTRADDLGKFYYLHWTYLLTTHI